MRDQITFLGDVWLPRPFKCSAALRGDFIFNLESPITGRECAAEGKVCLKAASSYIAETFGRRPVAVCLANNHIMDYGADGYRDTVAALREEGILYFGAGELKENCNNPLVLEVGGFRVGLLGYVCPRSNPVFARGDSAGVLPLDLGRIGKDLKGLKSSGVERLVVMLHWGVEQVHLPRPEDVKTAWAVVELGADLVVGHHSHTVQPIQLHRGKTICYGLGNCVFPDVHAPVIAMGARRSYSYRQMSWNQRSLAVTLGREFERPTVQRLVFRDGVLQAAGTRRHLLEVSKLPVQLSMHRYKQRFARHLKACAVRPSIARFLDAPGVPSWRQWASLFRMARASIGAGRSVGDDI